MSEPPAVPRSPSRLQLSGLPAELRDLIWEHAAPPPRLFHLRRFGTVGPSTEPPKRRPEFHRLHAPPAITAVCHESRRAALRLGFFLLPVLSPNGDAAVWLNASADVLYLDRAYYMGRGRGPFRETGFERVIHVGIEWRGLFRDGSMPVAEYAAPGNRALWVNRMVGLYTLCPAMKYLHYVLPMTRHQGGIPWGREPKDAGELEGQLRSLPGRIIVPLESGHVPWSLMEKAMRNALERGDVVEDIKSKAGDVQFPPKIVGEWLLRQGLASTVNGFPCVKEFTW